MNIGIMKLVYKDQILLLKNDDVIRIESADEDILVHYTNGRILKIADSLDHFQQQIIDPDFIRIHDKHIVNVTHILQIPDDPVNMIELNNHEFVPISRTIKNQIVKIINSHLQT